MKFQNILTLLATAETQIATARASVENLETFHALYDAALEAHPIFIAKCKDTNEVRNLMREAIAYAISKMELNNNDKILIDTSQVKNMILMSTTVKNNKITFECFNPTNQETIEVQADSVTALTQHGTKFNISP